MFFYSEPDEGGEILGGGASVVQSGLLARYDFGNTATYSGTGNTVYDLSGNGNDAILLDGAIVADNVLQLRGKADFDSIEIQNGFPMLGSEFTHMGWFYYKSGLDSFNAGISALFCSNNPYEHLWTLNSVSNFPSSYWQQITNNTTTGAAWSTYWQNYPFGNPPISPLLNWRHFAMSFNAGVTKIYLDGQLVVTNSSRGARTLPPANIKLRVGANWINRATANGDGSWGSHANVATVECYGRELTIEEIQQNMAVAQSRVDNTTGLATAA